MAHLLAWLPAAVAFSIFAVRLSVIDVKTHRLPNRIVLAFAVSMLLTMGLGSTLEDRVPAFATAVGIGAATLVVFVVMSLAAPRAMGMGDAKLAGVVGLCLGIMGATGVMAGLLAAFTMAAAFGVARILAGRAALSTRLAFGPFLLAGVPAGIALAFMAS